MNNRIESKESGRKKQIKCRYQPHLIPRLRTLELTRMECATEKDASRCQSASEQEAAGKACLEVVAARLEEIYR